MDRRRLHRQSLHPQYGSEILEPKELLSGLAMIVDGNRNTLEVILSGPGVTGQQTPLIFDVDGIAGVVTLNGKSSGIQASDITKIIVQVNPSHPEGILLKGNELRRFGIPGDLNVTPNLRAFIVLAGSVKENSIIDLNGGLDTPQYSIGTHAAAHIASGAGDDLLVGGYGNDTIDGGAGNDRIKGHQRDDVLYGGDGDDTISGGANNDFIYGGKGEDDLHGEMGVDSVYGGDGDDSVGTGQLIPEGEPLPADFNTWIDFGDGGNGNDNMGSYGKTVPGRSHLDGGPGNDTINTHAGSDTIIGGDGDDSINAGDGDDLIIGGLGNNRINGENGYDSILFYANVAKVSNTSVEIMDTEELAATRIEFIENVQLIVAKMFETVFFDASQSTLSVSGVGGLMNDTMRGGAGNDTLIGGGGADSISGHRGNDLLLGNSGDDTIQGGDGDDSLNGGNHNDSLHGDKGNNSVIGGSGYDTALFAGNTVNVSAQYVSIDYVDNTNTTELDSVEGIEIIPAFIQDPVFIDASTSSLPLVVVGGLNNDTMIGGAGNDTLIGGGGADSISGHRGNDFLIGNSGNDTIQGGDGDDVLYGGNDDDLLIGGGNADTLFGQNGVDTLWPEHVDSVFSNPGDIVNQ